MLMLKRSAFKRPVYVPPPRSPLGGIVRRAHAGATEMREPIEKHPYVRSRKLMVAYRALACQHCGADDGTVCGAHANAGCFGKGMAIKADDSRAASLCHKCHHLIDQGSILSEHQRKALWWRAHVKSVGELVRLGYWPADVAVPDVTGWPE